MGRIDLKMALEVAKKAALTAGDKILEVYNRLEIGTTKKEDDSPLTQADILANSVIVTELRARFPDHAVLTEEEADTKKRLHYDFVWIVDPLDGTKEFISRNGEFTVNIGLAYRGEPVLGVIYAPVTEDLYYATSGGGTYRENKGNNVKLHVSPKKDIAGFTLVKSRSHASEKLLKLIETVTFAEVKTSGSSIKGCRIAEGTADVYYRFGPTMEWDICAMNAIIVEAGGTMTDLSGVRLTYNKETPRNTGFIASNNTIHDKLVELGNNNG